MTDRKSSTFICKFGAVQYITRSMSENGLNMLDPFCDQLGELSRNLGLIRINKRAEIFNCYGDSERTPI